MSGKKIAVVVIPVIVAAIVLAAIFAFPSLPQLPEQDLAGSDSAGDDGAQVVPAGSSGKCADLNDRVRNVVTIDAPMNETRMTAANVLVEQYCQRTELVQEISAMSDPGLGLVAYGCDAASGRIGDSEIQSSLRSSSQIYCDNAFIVIFEGTEMIVGEAESYLDSLRQELENGDPDDEGQATVPSNSTADNAQIEDAQAKLEQIAEFSKKAQSQLLAQKYYEAAKSFDSATKLASSLSET